MRAIIPVAGVGTRLRPHTYSQPKALLNVAGKPILGHILDALLQQNITKATIITGYMAGQVEDFVRSKYKHIDCEFVLQEELLGLGHSIWVARQTFDSEPLLIILGDTVFDVDFSLVNSAHGCSIGVKAVEDPRRFGVVVTNSNGKIEKLIEKPENPVSNLAIVGLYLITETEALKRALEELIDRGIKTKGEYQLTDTLQLMIDYGVEFTTFPVDGWYDCGKPETLLSTNRYLLERANGMFNLPDSVLIPPVFISPKAKVERSVIGPFASVADGATVKDSIVRDTIISYGATVTNSLLEESIIGNDATVNGNFARLNVGNSSEINHLT